MYKSYIFVTVSDGEKFSIWRFQTIVPFLRMFIGVILSFGLRTKVFENLKTQVRRYSS